MRLKLTKLGELANEFGAMTPPQFWREAYKGAEQCAEDDGDLDLWFAERIAGLEALQDRLYEIMADADEAPGAASE